MLNLEKDTKELVRYCYELDEWIFEEQEMPEIFLITPNEIRNYVKRKDAPKRVFVQDKRDI